MEKKQKIVKAIICIITAILIAGCFIVMAFMPKIFKTNSASADVYDGVYPDTPPTSVEDIGFESITTTQNAESEVTNYQIVFYIKDDSDTGALYFNLPEKWTNMQVLIQMRYAAYRKTGETVLIQTIDTGTRVAEEIGRIPTSGYNDYISINKQTTTSWDAIRFLATGTKLNMFFLWFSITIANENNVVQKTYTYTSYLDALLSYTTDNAKEQGYNEGHEEGYNAGYQAGYDSGIVSDWESPVEIFIKPVDIFLSTNIFGSISIGDILSIILFVMVGIIFIKMFAGG